MAKDYRFSGTMPFERHVFERERLGIDFRLSQKEMETMKGWEIQHFEEDMGRSIVWRVQTTMAHGDKTVLKEERVPITWKDHLKLRLNIWSKWRLSREHFFFTNIAKAIQALKLRPKFRTIPTSILIKNYCPHIAVGDNRPHVEFMLHRQTEIDYFNRDVEPEFPYGGTG